MARTHLSFGLFVGTCVLIEVSNYYFHLRSPKVIYIFLSAVALGSLLPDIDEPNSLIGRKLFFLSYPINIIFRHRMFTHSFLFVIILSFLLFILNHYYTNQIFYIGIVIGIVAHILGDMHTKGGCPVFLPFSHKRFRILPDVIAFKTGSFIESFYTMLYTGLFIFTFFIFIKI